jgi:hypothetical protein
MGWPLTAAAKPSVELAVAVELASAVGVSGEGVLPLQPTRITQMISNARTSG